MGYFGQGILLKEQPTSDFLEAIPPQYGYTVFAHKLRPIWLLDLVRANRSEDFFEDEHPTGPHYDAPCSKCDRLRGIAGVRVLDIMELEGGRQFYRVPVENWPPNAGDPQSLLGIGTWDPFTNVAADYNVVAQDLRR